MGSKIAVHETYLWFYNSIICFIPNNEEFSSAVFLQHSQHKHVNTQLCYCIIVRGDVENISLLFYISFQAHLYSFPGEADTDTQLFSAVSVSFAPAADKSVAQKTFIVQLAIVWPVRKKLCPSIPHQRSHCLSEAGDKWKSWMCRVA